MPAARPLAVTALAGLVLGVTAATAAPGDVTRVSLPDSGPASNTQPLSELAAVSADGSRVAFTSTAQLTATATGGKRELYVRDLATGHTILASADSAGLPSAVDVEPGDNINPFFDISGGGRYAVYGVPDGAMFAVFRKDLSTGASLKLDETAVSPDPTSSYDGNRIAYRQTLPHIVMRDVAAGTTTKVSVNSQGDDPQGTNGVEDPAISADGRVVVFEAVGDGHGLVPNEAAPNINDIIVRNIAAGTTTAASVDSAGTAIGGNRPDISGDGRYVVFQLGGQIFRRDMQAGTTVLVSAKNGDVTAGNLASAGTQISADGSRVSFASNASDLIGAGADNNNSSDVFVRDVATKATRRVSTTAAGAEAPIGADSGAIGGNGARVAFTSLDAIVPTDANALSDVYATEQAPTDTAGPAVTLSGPADGAAVDGGEVQVAGTASDPSGVGAVTVAGQPVAVGAGGAFAATVPLGAPGQPVAIAVAAADGAGNTTTVTRTVARAVPPATAGGAGVPVAGGAVRPVSVANTAVKRPAVRGLSLSVVRGTLRVRFTLAVRSAVKVELLRVRRVAKRTRLVRIAVVRKTLAAGPRTLTLGAPKAGAVRVRVTATAGGRSVVALKSLVVRAR